MSVLDIINVFRLLDLEDGPDIKFYRHSDHNGWSIDEIEASGNLELFQKVQRSDQLGDSFVAFFVAEDQRISRFFGMYRVVDFQRSPKNMQDLEEAKAMGYWREGLPFYQLERIDLLNELRRRLVIKWPLQGRHHQWFRRKGTVDPKFELLEIRPTSELRPFPGFSDVMLTGTMLRQIFEDIGTSQNWRIALAKTRGVYLISDLETGALYVGSATGADGFHGRWKQYADNLHGGNKKLMLAIESGDIQVENFQISILETLSNLASRKDGLDAERRWKHKLGKRATVLNGN
jgi:hypothetical protein